MGMEHYHTLFDRFLRSPRTVGSVAPSSRFLTRRMMQPVEWERVRAIAELGAGTGVFTEAIRELCHPEARVLVFEQDPELRLQLRRAFPGFIHRADALQLGCAMAEAGIAALDCVISGLPLAMFPREQRTRLMDEVVRSLAPGGIFVQFQYSLQMLPELCRRFASVEIGFVPLNLPPAFVYVCRKQQ